MGRFKMPPQILRLVILTLVIVGSYVMARTLFTPTSFHEYGWYRGDALDEIAARKPRYAGRKACDECHSDEAHKLELGEHKTISCESCHGPAKAHSEDPNVKLYNLKDSDCMQCHETNPSRPKFIKQITIQEHYRGSRCTECHVPHHPSQTP